jgi:hypothetical protein
LAGEQIVQLAGEAVPDWFKPLKSRDFTHSQLPLWVGHVDPGIAPAEGKRPSAASG